MHWPAPCGIECSVSWEQLDDLLFRWDGFLDEFVVLTNRGVPTPLPRRGRVGEQKSHVDEHFRSGGTLLLHDLERRHAGVSAMCRLIELELGGRAVAKLFATPAGSAGYDLHFDGLDALILQFGGEKHWDLFGRHVRWPQRWDGRPLIKEEVGPVIEQITLRAGDALYIPGGVPHRVLGGRAASLHVSIGVAPITAFDVLSQVLASAARKVEALRQPLLESSDSPEHRLAGACRDAASALLACDPGAELSKYRQAQRASRPPVRSHGLADVAAAVSIDGSTRFQFDDASLHTLTHGHDGAPIVALGCSAVDLHGSDAVPTIEFPSFVAPDIAWIFGRRGVFCAHDIDGNLDLDSRLLLLGELRRHGVVHIAEP